MSGYYTAKEAMEKLKKPTTTFYREVKDGIIPHVGKRPNMRFPKEAIDALAELISEDIDSDKLTFTCSTNADAWVKQEITRQPYPDEDAVPFKTVLAWRKRNDEISMNVKEGDKILGWTTFLPLEEEVAVALINGEIREKDIPIKSIKKWTDKQLSVYVPIIEALPTGDKQRDRNIGRYLIRKTLQWAAKLSMQYDIKNWYGVGVTPVGQDILETLGFRHVTTLDEERKGYMLDTRTDHVRFLDLFTDQVEEKGESLAPEEESKARN